MYLTKKGCFTFMRLLLAEDDDLLGDGLCVGLKQAGYTVDWVQDGVAAVNALHDESFELVVLDLGLPKMSGMEVLKQLRSSGNNIPVLILTALDRIEQRVAGLDGGADDYLVKPFDLNELCARLRVLQRRSAGRSAPVISYKGIVLDPAAHEVIYNGKQVILSHHEFVVLQYLLENIGRVVSRSKIEEVLYGWDGVESNSLEVFIHHLRKKFSSQLIKTVRGVGYIIEKAA